MTEQKNLEFTLDITKCVQESDIIFICVNTPPVPTKTNELPGTATDMRAFWSVVKNIGTSLKGLGDYHKIIVEKSTVPVGTSVSLKDLLAETLQKSKSEIDDLFTIVSSPEFLAEGCAIQNLTYPERVVIGTPPTENGAKAFNVMCQLYKT